MNLDVSDPALQNFIKEVFRKSIDIMGSNDWEWPSRWDTERKLNFLNDSLNYANDNEFFEQSAIIRDVTKKVKDEEGSISGNAE
jgi:protein-arginine kinase activator protein McsA